MAQGENMRRMIVIGLVSSVLGLHAQVLNFTLQGQGGSGMLPSNEEPPVVSSGSGFAVAPTQYDPSNHQFTFEIDFSNLSAPAQSAWIKGPVAMTSPSSPVNVLYDLTTGFLSGQGNTSGKIKSPGIGGTLTLVDNPNGNPYTIAEQEAQLTSGLWVIELTSNDPASQFGEIRANFVPEPSQYAAITGLILVGFAALRRRFQRQS
jgi:hypothetical protein